MSLRSEVDKIPPSFYPIIHKELADHVVDVPSILTREWLNPYGCTGSNLNPFIVLDIPDNMLVKYGKVLFSKSTVAMPQQNLVADPKGGSKIYLNLNGVYRHVATFHTDDLAGICIQPMYQLSHNGRIHYCYHVDLDIVPGNNIDIYRIRHNGQTELLLHQKVSTGTRLHETPINLQNSRRVRDQISSPSIRSQISQLTAYETLYLDVLVQDHSLVCPYEHISRIRQQIYMDIDRLERVTKRFHSLLNKAQAACGLDMDTDRADTDLDTDSDLESCLLDLAQNMSSFSSDDLLTSIKSRYWRLAIYILDRGVAIDRNSVLDILLLEHQNVFVVAPDELITKLYNWRNVRMSDRLKHALKVHGRYDLASRINYIPFRPSRLRKCLTV